MEEQEESEEQIINPKIIFTCAIFFSIGMIIVATFLIISEINEAKKSCNKLDMEYKFKILQGHLCDGRKFIEYNSCIQGRGCELIWEFEDSINEINISEFIK